MKLEITLQLTVEGSNAEGWRAHANHLPRREGEPDLGTAEAHGFRTLGEAAESALGDLVSVAEAWHAS